MKWQIFLVAVALLVTTVRSDINAVAGDIKADCGKDGKIESITYTNSDTVNNKVAKMSSPKNRDTCSTTTQTRDGKMVISDVSTNCDIVQGDPTKAEYFLQITLQEVAGVYQQQDPTFIVDCKYVVDEVPVSTVIADGGPIGNPTQVEVLATGNPDMTYSLTILDSTQTPTTGAKFGDDVILRVAMSGTDADEQGVQVKACNVSSGGVSVPIIQDKCVVEDKKALFQLQGFVSQSTTASLPLKVFAVEGSKENSVEFSCIVTVCSSACDGANCPTARRKRRASGDEPAEDKTVTMATRLQILPVVVSSPAAETDRPNAQTTESCMQSLSFIITVAVLAVLLVVALAAVIYMFTARRREFQKDGA